LSEVESEGSDEAMKSTSRPGSSMFIRHRRELVGKRGRTGNDLLKERQYVALKGFDFGILGGIVSGIVSTCARMKGSVERIPLVERGSSPSAKTNRLVRHLDHFVTTASVPTL